MPRYNKSKDSVRKIAIKFGDNDFGNCFTVLLKTLYEAYKWTEYLPKDKDKLSFIINKLSPVMYIIGQNCWEYNGLQEENKDNLGMSKECLHTENYLQITPKKILIDDEVDKMVKEGEPTHFFNGEIFVLDTTLHNNNVYIL